MTKIIDNKSIENNPSGMNWYDQTSEDFENTTLLSAKLLLVKSGAEEVIIQGKDSWGVDIILFNWGGYSYELMLVLYDGPGKSEVIINNLVTDKMIKFENELNLDQKITKHTLKNLI